MVDAEHLKQEYLQTNVTYRALAKKYHIGYGALCKLAKEQGWATLKKNNSEECAHCNHGNLVSRVADCLLEKMLSQVQTDQRIESGPLKQYTSALKDLRDIKGVKHPYEQEELALKLEQLRQKSEKTGEVEEICLVVQGGDGTWVN